MASLSILCYLNHSDNSLHVYSSKFEYDYFVCYELVEAYIVDLVVVKKSIMNTSLLMHKLYVQLKKLF